MTGVEKPKFIDSFEYFIDDISQCLDLKEHLMNATKYIEKTLNEHGFCRINYLELNSICAPLSPDSPRLLEHLHAQSVVCNNALIEVDTTLVCECTGMKNATISKRRSRLIKPDKVTKINNSRVLVEYIQRDK